MKTLTGLLAACLAVGIATSLWADVDPDFQAAMKNVVAANKRVKKGVEAKASGEDIAKDADDIAMNFHKMGGYFKKNNMTDALEMCKTAATAATAMSKAAKAGNMEDAAAQFKAVGESCGNCHHAHRDKAADGSYIIK